MEKTTLLVMAAGIGARYGAGIKQLATVDEQDHIIIDYSIHDAIAAGFDRIVFIIRHDIEQEFREVIGDRIEHTGLFELYNRGSRMPIICYKLKADAKYKDGTPVVWNLYDLSDRLRMHGWQVPAYPLPDGAEEVTVQRIVCRADLTFNLAEAFVTDFRECLEDLKHAHVLCNEEKSGAYGFTH